MVGGSAVVSIGGGTEGEGDVVYEHIPGDRYLHII